MPHVVSMLVLAREEVPIGRLPGGGAPALAFVTITLKYYIITLKARLSTVVWTRGSLDSSPGLL